MSIALTVNASNFTSQDFPKRRKQTGPVACGILLVWLRQTIGDLLRRHPFGKDQNEITAVPEILKQLLIKGAIVTLDAMGCQENTVAQICDAEADYVIALKGNQGELYEVVKNSFDLLDKGAVALQPTIAKDEIDSEYGRIDQREIQVINVAKLGKMIDSRWGGLKSIARIIYTSEFEGQTQKASIRRKQLKVWASPAYLSKIL